MFASRPSDIEIYKTVMGEVAKHRGIDVSIYAYVGNRANGMSWKAIDDKAGKYIRCDVNASGQLIEGSVLFTSRAKALRR